MPVQHTTSASVSSLASTLVEHLTAASAIIRHPHAGAPEYRRAAAMLRTALEALDLMADADDAVAGAPDED